MLTKIQIYNILKVFVRKIHNTTCFATLTHSFHNYWLVRGVIQPGLKLRFYLSLIHILHILVPTFLDATHILVPTFLDAAHILVPTFGAKLHIFS